MTRFTAEQNFYKKNHEKLIKLFHGKYLLIKGHVLCGVFDSFQEGAKAHSVITTWDQPYMLRQCLYNTPVIHIPGGTTWRLVQDHKTPVDAHPEDLKVYNI